ncbi:tRNA lysidine(34) synthetase TilS [Conservatibacter flavescens]|uniref:tRNA(Ile)-lysidine synthase n=1 Tax=Conservatibacter flavescens TaxID=28161 RepID=A0A2M8S0W8_9PAST|nr:tRNA lysidine(34) synthetase TilS [Conservatibacter flavescens]PJG84754.1 tRNA lysidine(34) synthetase TilS [Conservatibacter flavescens]
MTEQPLITDKQHELESIVAQKITAAYHNTSPKFLLALSGGLDSTALLLLLAKLRQILPNLALRAVHIHHGLSPNADAWALHCQSLCQQLNVPFLCCKVQIDRKNGIEQGAREARYQAIAQIRDPDEVVITAHHQQDQTETFLLALKRGSGLQGLSAMQTHNTVYHLPIFRPLLNISRPQLEAYVKTHHMTWVEDESNEDDHYDRNFLRNQILAPLRERWTYFDQAVQRSAQHCFEQQQLINELLAEIFHQIYQKTDRSLSIAHFHTYSKPKQCGLLRLWLTKHQLAMPSQTQLYQLINDVIFAQADRNPQFQLQQSVVRRYQSRLYITPCFHDIQKQEIPIQLNETIELPDGLGKLSLSKNQEKLTALWQQHHHQWKSEFNSSETHFTIRFSYSGKIKLNTHSANQDIKKVWQSLNVPPWQRHRIPLIFEGNKLKSAVGFFTTF